MKKNPRKCVRGLKVYKQIPSRHFPTSKLTIETLEQDVNVNDVDLVSLLLTLKIFNTRSSVSIANFEHVIAGWVPYLKIE